MKKYTVLLIVIVSILFFGCSGDVVSDADATPQDGEYYSYKFVQDNTTVKITFYGNPDSPQRYYALAEQCIVSSGSRIRIVGGYFQYVGGMKGAYIYEESTIHICGNFIVTEDSSER